MDERMGHGAIVESIDKLKDVRITFLNDEEEVHIDNKDENYDDYDDDEQDNPVTLRFLEKPENISSLYGQDFPCKAGGVPAWLDPLNIPSGKSYTCDICGEPLKFLLQVYVPTEKESTFHRMLFVFMCPSMKCLLQDQREQRKLYSEKPSRTVKVFRCQLPLLNPFSAGSGAALCDWCGTWKGDKICTSCRQVWYCSEKYQVMHWRSGHEIACQQIKVSSQTVISNQTIVELLHWSLIKVGDVKLCRLLLAASNTMWPEFKIIRDNESEYNRNMSKSNASANSLISSDDIMNSPLENFQGDDEKKSWAFFLERISMARGQVLRYYRDTNAECCYCGGPLCCEFQILPQLLYYFDVENERDSLDWASIVVYTCEASCDAGVAYKNEYAWVQLDSPSTTRQ